MSLYVILNMTNQSFLVCLNAAYLVEKQHMLLI